VRALRRRLHRVLAPVPLVLPAWRALSDRLSPHRRAVKRIAAEPSSELLQPSDLTWTHRYPELFAALAERLAGIAEPQILSFGCATGEEVFTLRELFPAAHITGLEINPRSVAKAERRLARQGGDARIRFVCAGSPTPEDAGRFDAVLALAVLRHGDLQQLKPESCSELLPFAKVDRTISALAGCVRPGGYLAIWHSHFRFADMAASSDFGVDWSDAAGARKNSPLYGPDDRRLALDGYAEAIFRKHR
jgi:hypothetical protein